MSEIKKIKCRVCGNEIELKKENRYTGIERNMLGPDFLRDCYDCPVCGCQSVVNNRLKTYEEGRDENDF